MKQWFKSAPSQHRAMPILSFPGAFMIGESVDSLVKNGEFQAKCLKAISDKYDMLASVSLMDLSVEAEAFGSPVRFSKDEVPTVTKAVLLEGDDPDTLQIPNIGKKRTGEYIKAIAEAKKLITKTPLFAGSIGPFSLAGRLLDLNEIMVMCYTEPEFVHAVLEKATSFLIAYNNAFKAAGANGLVMAEPAAGLLSPGLMSEFSTPYVNKIIKAVSTDDFAVIYHNCGNVIPLIDSVLKTGAPALHFGNAIELCEILPLIPEDILVFGNVDPAREFRNGTPNSIRQNTLDILEKCSKFDNFIISSGCDIPPQTPPENIDAFFTAVKDFYG